MWIKDVMHPESFGFASRPNVTVVKQCQRLTRLGRQVTPFNISSPDGETLFAWHMVSLGAYVAHEDEFTAEPAGIRSNLRETVGFKILQNDPEARVIINLHGNAGHLADGHRIQIYRSLTNLSPRIHVFSMDYRGFGYSTGSPHEAGLIADAITLVNYVLSLGIPPSRIVLLGQSLGTAVTSSVALHFADRAASLKLLPPTTDSNLTSLFTGSPAVVGQHRSNPIDFAGVILVASFPEFPELLRTYRMAGFIPVLGPLQFIQGLQDLVVSFVQEKWPTSLRLEALVSAAASNSKRKLRLHLIHALDDPDIPWPNGEKNYEACYHALAAVAGESKIGLVGVDWGTDGFKREARLGQRVKIMFETLKFGGKLLPSVFLGMSS